MIIHLVTEHIELNMHLCLEGKQNYSHITSTVKIGLEHKSNLGCSNNRMTSGDYRVQLNNKLLSITDTEDKRLSI